MFERKEERNTSIYTKYIDKAIRGANIEDAANSVKKTSEVSQDTKNRIDIHSYIHKLVSEEKGFMEILTELNNKFSAPEYIKYKEFFPICVMDKLEKNQKKNNKERDF